MFSDSEYRKVKHELRFRDDGGFKILMLTDLHGGRDTHPQLKPAVDAIVEHVKPDMVLLGGDIGSLRNGCTNIGEVVTYLTSVTEVLEKNRIPWAHVFGNHDANDGVPNAEQQDVYESFEWCVSKRGPEYISGVSNYVLPVLTHDGSQVAANIWALDSNEGMGGFTEHFGLPADTKYVLPNHFCEGYGSDNVHVDQVLWYYQTSQSIERCYGRKIPGIMYMHIPLPEYCLIPRNPEECGMIGGKGETIGTSEINNGMFAACLERGDVRAIYCGHDHWNDYSGTYCGIHLAYCEGMCYDAGGRDENRGGRIIELHEDDPGRVDTRIVSLREAMGADADNRFGPRGY